MKNSHDAQIRRFEKAISDLNNSLDFLTDSYLSLTPEQLTKILVKLENSFLNTHSTLEWLSFKTSKPRRKIRVIRIEDGDHLVIKCSKKRQNQVVKEEVSFGLMEEIE